ncbi:AbrB/MazE/SpoVT family DNA-binding domain-containing protein [Candidatus Tisiphia endosymbiont of Hybos culiciformis]|uniref:AbrB/MazE/SpoVT family DNA-binding domain-containing protein n=1 Tax=Candidatus Tisiphia endosymbiont of Hybos culiciformis TaxID=3139331 RepID=UPI003CCAFBB4
MHAEIIKIGNSKGLRIPKVFLKQCKIKNVVNLIVKDHALIITPYEKVRVGWEESFQLMAKNEDDYLLDINLIKHSWDEEEWNW